VGQPLNKLSNHENHIMELIKRLIIVALLIVGFAPYESRISSANYSENEILTDAETNSLTKLLASDVIYKIDSVISRFSSHYRFSGNVLVALSGTEIYSKSVGYADPIKKEHVKPETIFQMASVSKQFTAAAIMLLKSDGRLSFEDSLVKYIPEVPYPAITINHLLHHISGLPNYMYLLDKYWKKDYAPDNEDVIDLMARYKLSLYFRPGSRYDYSNTGYVMLASVVERITGLSLNEFLQRRIFRPLEMNSTFVYSTADTAIQRLQIDGFRALRHGYIRIKDSHHNGPVGDKGICSTTSDLMKWDRALYNDSPFNKELLEMAFTPAVTTGGKEVPYGLGFRLRQCNGSKVVYHNGIWEGSRTNFHRFIEQGNTIIVLNNTSISTNHELVRQIERILTSEENLQTTSKITRIVLEEGLEAALNYYSDLTDNDSVSRPDIRKLMQAAEYMHSIGKDNKAEEMKELVKSMVSI